MIFATRFLSGTTSGDRTARWTEHDRMTSMLETCRKCQVVKLRQFPSTLNESFSKRRALQDSDCGKPRSFLSVAATSYLFEDISSSGLSNCELSSSICPLLTDLSARTTTKLEYWSRNLNLSQAKLIRFQAIRTGIVAGGHIHMDSLSKNENKLQNKETLEEFPRLQKSDASKKGGDA